MSDDWYYHMTDMMISHHITDITIHLVTDMTDQW